MIREDGDTDSHPQIQLVFLEPEGLQKTVQNIFCDFRGSRFSALNIGQQYGKFVAPKTGQRVALPQHASQALRHLTQHLIAGRMPQGVIDFLEVVQVHQHQNNLLILLAFCHGYGLVKPVIQQ